MKPSQKCINLIKKCEGCSLKAYLCPANIPTIGYGHTCGVKLGQTVTQAEAEKLLDIDLIAHSNNVEKLVKVPLTQNQFDALVSFEFNIGYSRFKNSTLLKLLNQNKYDQIPFQLKKWVYGGGKILNGLVKRRNLEAALFMEN